MYPVGYGGLSVVPQILSDLDMGLGGLSHKDSIILQLLTMLGSFIPYLKKRHCTF